MRLCHKSVQKLSQDESADWAGLTTKLTICLDQPSFDYTAVFDTNFRRKTFAFERLMALSGLA
jgi:hypothetical protein